MNPTMFFHKTGDLIILFCLVMNVSYKSFTEFLAYKLSFLKNDRNSVIFTLKTEMGIFYFQKLSDRFKLRIMHILYFFLLQLVILILEHRNKTNLIQHRYFQLPLFLFF